MRRLAALLSLGVVMAACGPGGLFRAYEYEEELYLSLDGSATVYVNGSVAALDTLRGASFDTNPRVQIDSAEIARFFSTPVTRVTSVKTSRRHGRQFVHVQLEVDDVRALGRAEPFSWSSYTFRRDGNLFVFGQAVGGSVAKDIGAVGWTGSERVAFRLHLPSKIEYHNTEADNLRRGNILVWEQSLADRRRGKPLTLDARMQTESILYRTLWLFGATFAAVVLMFAVLIWWVLRRGVHRPSETGALNGASTATGGR